MRLTPSILILLCGTASAAETWRWVDENGVVHFSDQPGAPNAELVELRAAPPTGSVPPPQVTLPARSDSQPFRYTSCAIASPIADQVFVNERSVSVSLNIRPGLQPGHRISVQLDGRPVTGWPADAQGYQIQDLPRGSHTLTAVIHDETGRVSCNSGALTFHVRLPSALSPGSQSARQRTGVQGVPTVPRAGGNR